MDEFIIKITSFLRYVPYIHEKKVKVHRSITILPLFMKECLEFDNPKTMEEVMWKARICYQQNKPNEDVGKRWADKKGNKFPCDSKGNKAIINKGPHKGRVNKNLNRNQSKFIVPNQFKTNEESSRNKIEIASRPLVKCWGCGGPHYVKKCPNRKGTNQMA